MLKYTYMQYNSFTYYHNNTKTTIYNRDQAFLSGLNRFLMFFYSIYI